MLFKVVFLPATHKNLLFYLYSISSTVFIVPTSHCDYFHILTSSLSSPSACLGNPLMVGRGRWIMAVSSNRRSRRQDPSQVMRDPRARTLGSTQPCYGWTRCKGRLPDWAHRCALTVACRATESTNDWSES